MRSKTVHGAIAVIFFSTFLLQFVARWSPVVFSRLSPPGGWTDTITTDDDPSTVAVATVEQ